MTERERRFVDAYMGAAAGNGTEAAKAAGYGSPRQAASRLLTKSSVSDEIATRQAKIATERDKALAIVATADIRTRVERQQWWSKVMWDETVPWPIRVKASELLGRSEADFVDRHEHSGKDGGPIAIEDVRTQLVARAASLDEPAATPAVH